MKLKSKEIDIQKSILEWLSYQPNVFAFRTNNIGVPVKTNTGMMFRPSPVKGLADIIACVRGHFVAFEVKSEKGKLSEHQKIFGDNVRESFGQYHCVKSLDEVIKVVSNI